jgi:hypothetical protein
VFFTHQRHPKRVNKFIGRFTFIILFFLTSSLQASTKVLALKLVATIEDQIVTSREVEANYLVDKALYGKTQGNALSVGTQEFTEALTRLLVEMMVSEEAAFFDVAKVSESETEDSYRNVKTIIFSNSASKTKWQHLNYTDVQLKAMVTRKLRANRFIKYKSNSSYVEPSTEEAQQYFDKNRLKFGTMKFNQFQTNIKKYLGTKSAEDRLRDWFDVLRKKHRVKNFLTGTTNYDFSSTPDK